MWSLINSHKINRISRRLFEKVWRIIERLMFGLITVSRWLGVWWWGKNCPSQLPVCWGGVNNVLMSRLCLSLLCLQLPALHWYREPSATPAPLLDSPRNRENSLRGKIVGFWKELLDLTVGLHWLSGGKILPVLLRCKTGQHFNIFSAPPSGRMREARVDWVCAVVGGESPSDLQTFLQTWRALRWSQAGWLEAAPNWSNWQGEGNISATPITPARHGNTTPAPEIISSENLFKIYLCLVYFYFEFLLVNTWLLCHLSKVASGNL